MTIHLSTKSAENCPLLAFKGVTAQKDSYKFSMKPGIPLVSLAYWCVAKDARNAGLHYSLQTVLLDGAASSTERSQWGVRADAIRQTTAKVVF